MTIDFEKELKDFLIAQYKELGGKSSDEKLNSFSVDTLKEVVEFQKESKAELDKAKSNSNPGPNIQGENGFLENQEALEQDLSKFFKLNNNFRREMLPDFELLYQSFAPDDKMNVAQDISDGEVMIMRGPSGEVI
jgi:hypothetical protein